MKDCTQLKPYGNRRVQELAAVDLAKATKVGKQVDKKYLNQVLQVLYIQCIMYV